MEQKKTFTFDEARALIGGVRERTKRAVDDLAALEMPDADHPDVEKILAAWVHDMQALGIEVKGPWLIDFDSGGGYYCWKWPEERLEYFHDYETGFGGRVRLQ